MTEGQEQKRDSAHPLLYVLTSLVVLNLVVTVWIALHYAQVPAAGPQASRPLPAAVERARDGYAAQVIEAYNRQDFAELYGLFDPLARAQSSEEMVAEAFGRWREVLGNITSFSYSHHQAFDRQAERDWYDLFYETKFSGETVRSGVLKIRIAGNGDSFGIMRVDLTAD